MNINLARLKKWDWGVVVAFVVTIVGVSIPWWKDKVTDVLGGFMDEAGELGEVIGGAVAADVASVKVFGWDMDAGVAAFVFCLFAVLWVFSKVLLPADKPIPKWYMEAWGVLVLGGVVALCGFIGLFQAPYGGFDLWSWLPGSLITFIAGLGVVFCGYMMLKDKSGDYGESPMPKVTTTGSGTPPGAPPAGGPQRGGPPPAAQ